MINNRGTRSSTAKVSNARTWAQHATHTVEQWLDVKDMYAAAEMTLEIMKLNGELAKKS